ncbi:hypothetical protein [Duncaniella sp.]|uniref:hypothetical protein n=1 Tax=Duncaniella sp. TaxID=2518496 RepID=UPI0023CBBBBB|nr:hypothetical protein [Duncaniella sp.]MDE5905266.1 hypothetical protein [Duncaniella sp.]
MNSSDFLTSTIQDYEKGGLHNVEFLKKAHSIYNEYASYPTPLIRTAYPYSLGIVFSYFAKYYSNNIDYYTCIIENALFCLNRAIEICTSQNEQESAAIRLLLLIEDNDWVMKGITHKFYERSTQELYGLPLIAQTILAQRMDPWTFETEILKHIGAYCIQKSNFPESKPAISDSDILRLQDIISSGKYNIRWPLVKVPTKRVYELFLEFIAEFIRTPYDRRITQLIYKEF